MTLNGVRTAPGTVRAHGVSFDDAWPAAVAAALRGRDDRDEWLAVLEATRPAWAAAWHATRPRGHCSHYWRSPTTPTASRSGRHHASSPASASAATAAPRSPPRRTPARRTAAAAAGTTPATGA